jgi:chromosome segregation ATPase
VRLTRVEEKVTALSGQIDRLSPKIVRQDFEKELNARDTRIQSLEDQVQRLTRNVADMQERLRESGAENARLRSKLADVRGAVSEIASDLRSLSQDVGSKENQLPEGYRSYLLKEAE